MYQENVALKSRSNDTAWKISMTVQRIVISNTLYKINELEVFYGHINSKQKVKWIKQSTVAVKAATAL